MTVTAQQSTQVANGLALPAVKNEIVDLAKLRLAHFDFTQVGAGALLSTVDLVKLGAGRYRILPGLSYLTSTALVSTAEIDVGHTGYTKLDGTVVAAAPDCIEDGLVATSAVAAYLGAGSGANAAVNIAGLDIETKGDLLIQAIINVAGIPDGAVIKGWIAFLTD